jgi:protein involved in polysaccharide export with SLBB domain
MAPSAPVRTAGTALGLVLAVLLAAGPARGQQPPPEVPAPAPYRIAHGDTLEVKFPFNSELNETTIVRPDGLIALQMIGEIQAAGLTPAALSVAVQERYAKFLKAPDATVLVREFALERVFLGGEVGAPGTLSLRGGLSLLQAVINAGGIRTSARLDSVILIRRQPDDSPLVERVNLKQVMDGSSPDVPLHAFDVVFVPKSRITKVGDFVEQYISNLIPRQLSFPYNLNSQVTVRESGN